MVRFCSTRAEENSDFIWKDVSCIGRIDKLADAIRAYVKSKGITGPAELIVGMDTVANFIAIDLCEGMDPANVFKMLIRSGSYMGVPVWYAPNEALLDQSQLDILMEIAVDLTSVGKSLNIDIRYGLALTDTNRKVLESYPYDEDK